MKNVIKTSFVYFPAFLAAIIGLLQWVVLKDLPESPVYLMACSVPFALLVALLQVFPWVLIANIFQRKTRIVRNRLVLLPLFVVNAFFPTLTQDLVVSYLLPIYTAYGQFVYGPEWTMDNLLTDRAQTTWMICLFIALAMVAVAYRVQKKSLEANPDIPPATPPAA